MKVDTSEYKLIDAAGPAQLTELVTEQMRAGFRPWGRPAIYQDYIRNVSQTRYCQAMTKIKKFWKLRAFGTNIWRNDD